MMQDAAAMMMLADDEQLQCLICSQKLLQGADSLLSGSLTDLCSAAAKVSKLSWGQPAPLQKLRPNRQCLSCISACGLVKYVSRHCKASTRPACCTTVVDTRCNMQSRCMLCSVWTHTLRFHMHSCKVNTLVACQDPAISKAASLHVQQLLYHVSGNKKSAAQ